MKRLFFSIAVICVLIATSAFAADNNVGLKLGLDMSKLNTSDAKYKTGFALGGFMTSQLTGNWVLQPELLYCQKGTKVEDAGMSGQIKTSYLDVPVLFKYIIGDSKADIKTGLLIGPSFSLKVSKKLTGDLAPAVVSDTIKVKSFTAGLILGVDVDFNQFIIDLRYEAGLTKAVEIGNDSWKNRMFQLSAGFKF